MKTIAIFKNILIRAYKNVLGHHGVSLKYDGRTYVITNILRFAACNNDGWVHLQQGMIDEKTGIMEYFNVTIEKTDGTIYNRVNDMVGQPESMHDHDPEGGRISKGFKIFDGGKSGGTVGTDPRETDI